MNGVTESGMYPIDPDGPGNSPPFTVYCDFQKGKFNSTVCNLCNAQVRRLIIFRRIRMPIHISLNVHAYI